MARSIHQPIIDYLISLGAEDTAIIQGGKHPRINFTYKGEHRFLATSLTPSDHRAFKNQQMEVRHLLAEIDQLKPDYVEEPEEAAKPRRLPALDTIGKRLQFAREQQQLSRSKLSQITYVPLDIIENIETDRLPFLSQLTALKLSTALGLSLSYLTGEEDERRVEPMSTLGSRVREERTKHNLTIGMLAAKTGIPVQQLANLETGTMTEFFRLDEVAEALDCTAEYLRTGVTEEEATVPVSITSKQELGRVLRYYREKAGLGQGEVCRKLGYSQSYLSKVERTGTYVSKVFDNFDALTKLLQIPENVVKSIDPALLQYPIWSRAPKVTRPEQAPVQTAKQFEAAAEAVIEKYEEIPEATFSLAQILTAIHEEAQQTRELMRVQHATLVNTLHEEFGAAVHRLSGVGVADTLHTLIDNLFKPRE